MIFGQGVEKGRSETIQEILKLPKNLMPSNSRTCQIVQVSYHVEVEAIVSGCHKNVVLRTPVVIGTVPINMNTLPVFNVIAINNLMSQMPSSVSRKFENFVLISLRVSLNFYAFSASVVWRSWFTWQAGSKTITFYAKWSFSADLRWKIWNLSANR